MKVIWWFAVKKINDGGSHFGEDYVIASDINVVSHASGFSEQSFLELEYCVTLLQRISYKNKRRERGRNTSAGFLPVYLSFIVKSYNLFLFCIHIYIHICTLNDTHDYSYKWLQHFDVCRNPERFASTVSKYGDSCS